MKKIKKIGVVSFGKLMAFTYAILGFIFGVILSLVAAFASQIGG